MLNDLEIITKKFPGNDNITIIPISDVHLGAKEHMQREWEMFSILNIHGQAAIIFPQFHLSDQ